jgi:uncharacterized repeat protein (TIGR01451 family)
VVFLSHQPRKSYKVVMACLGTALFFLSLVTPARAQNSPPRKLSGHIPAAVAKLTPLGRENGSDRLKLAIGLPLRNQDELTNLLQQIYDPASPNYHHYLTPEEFTARFGPTEEDYQEVIRYANESGFTVTATHPNRVVLDVDAAVTDIEKSLQVVMRTYQHPREARIFHAPDTEPTVAAAVPILHISGLDDYSLPHPKLKPRPMTLTNATPQSGAGPGGAYRGSDFRAAYSVGTRTGAGQSVGLLQFDGYYAADISNYESQAGLPSVPLTNVSIDGGVSTPGSGVGEVSLDIEMAISMAPGLSKIIVYEAPNPSPWVDLLSRMATDNLAKQLSCSWGGGSPDPTSEQIFLQMAAQGQSFFNASGDSDAFTGAIDFPSDSTNITQVGGTTLTTTGPGGSYVSETVWNWGLSQGSYVGSSGGISTVYAIPLYQQGIDMTANQGSTTMRNVPDVALTGDNVYVLYNNGTTGTFGGTSCAAPLWAGFMALVNEQAAALGHGPIGFANPALYAIGKSNPNYASIFHDITTGNNFSSSSPSLFSATAGYDLCTGWGSPNGTNLINALIPAAPAPVIAAAGTTLLAEGCSPTNGAIDSGETVTVNFALKNIGPVNTTNLVVTLLATNGVGLPSGAQTYGALAGGGSAVSQPFSFTALGACGATITPTFQLQDGATNLGTVSFSLPLGTLAQGYTQNFDGVSAPSLPTGWTSTAGGGESVWVTSTSTRDSTPNSAFSADAASVGSNALVSAAIVLPAGPSAQLSFRNNYNLEARSADTTTAYDGGVLEIKIGAGSFVDILAAGGNFLSGGYNRTVSGAYSNPLGGRAAWSGNSGGFIPTVVNLPAAASGQTIQLRWRCGTDSSVGSTGWYIDSIAISNVTCCSGTVADLAESESVSPVVANLSSNVIFTVNVTNFGPDAASVVAVSDILPPGLTFTTASVSQGTWTNNGNTFNAALGTLANGARATVTIQAFANAAGSWTNSATVSSSAADSNSANNTAAVPAPVNSPPTISGITNVVTSENTAAGPIGFVIGDAETAPSALVLSAASSNPSLIDAAQVVFGGSGANRTVTLNPLANQYGAATITLFVNDGLASTATSFTLTVNQANQPAVLQPIPDFTILEKSTLTFTNKAADADQPPETLTYSLSNAPPGATVGPASGVFTWTPAEGQAPGTNLITVVVTDNGTPPLSVSQSFNVAVLESNEPPVLAPIPDRTIHAGMTVTITNSATDPDVPTNSLTFSLAPAPAGAAINATNGVFTWTPDNSFANTTNTVTVTVTDYNPWAVNTQHLSDAKSFTVTVVPPPSFSSGTLSNGALVITWSSIPGQTYRVQYSTNLSDGAWQDLSPDITAGDVTASQSDSTSSGEQRFYRVMVVP